ncbi:MAG: triose-phosphate isomerase [Candidatus Komeilibacteria bacterium CG11_big_fil_rev_8_21_14_0_20_36_20]|uniref:Triosephosphate isomerase n=1 Tax=Candidatus Komeilibacteria bacterium CG11_big_fil_rev_8_21_14_0_20_36_20 TaxID=1974477 RepID=A0A2H0NB08_9BACT|nr:MAG: triose-phosphate isomerase [Candidatus Komeilibacteria bacterium CG11_big_fil_rev_8_21_14_0_20_36_20]PIR82085.1 MAG: triose-phosphate isomerase [Candidatus Komeilibacteria bacterium CG10_big_fil_rev_8_21_14_0_10_36_65]PJC55694.1 MAG: triose-phosphate isomerase [Candidatus Komeilibacteria bacterium CG_4_9_14_0_2_um_filter_36_13]
MKSFDKIIIANWKMQLTVSQAEKQAKKIKKLLSKSRLDKKTAIVVCPDFLALTEIADVFKGTRVAYGAQDGFAEDVGAYTGEESFKNLKAIGCDYVIIGHSERREMGETDKIINKKVRAALKNDLTPIICIGETFDERKEGNKDLVLMHQVHQALYNIELKQAQQIIIAYEPVWVIGSGQAISMVEADHTAAVIRQHIIDALDGHDLSSFSIIYGGSVSPDNIRQFTSLKNIKGALVGTASLRAEIFVELIKNA